jgi:hypothetical protein
MAARSETPEAQTPDGFKKDGYNAGVTTPVSVEPIPKSRMGQAHDVRTMKGDGVVEVHDDDDEILDKDRKPDESVPKP